MIDLYIVPLTIHNKSLVIAVPEIMLLENHYLLHTKIDSDSNLNEAAVALASPYFADISGLQLDEVCSGGTSTFKNLTVVYRLIHTETQSYPSLMSFTDIKLREGIDGEVEINAIAGIEHEIIQIVASNARKKLTEVIKTVTNKEGFKLMLQLLPDVFDHKELAIAYESIFGKKPPSPLMLAKSMLDEYEVGKEGRKVNGRNLISVFDDSDSEEAIIDEKRIKYSDDYKKGGRKARQLYTKVKG